MMRVEYTIAGWEPPVHPAAAGEPPGPSFRDTLRRQAEPPPVSWRQLLRVDEPARTGSILPPPPRPAGLDLPDAAAYRARWGSLLARHRLADITPSADSRERAVQAMMALLEASQKQKTGLISRRLAESRG